MPRGTAAGRTLADGMGDPAVPHATPVVLRAGRVRNVGVTLGAVEDPLAPLHRATG